MDKAPGSRFDGPSFGGPARIFEPTLSCVLPWQGSAVALRRYVLPLLDDVSAVVRLWELIVVDDGCADADATAMAAWAQVEGVRVMRLARRVGRDAAIAIGLQVAHGDVVAVLQGEDPRASELIAGLLTRWRQGFDVVHSSAPLSRKDGTSGTRRTHSLRGLSSVGAPLDDLAFMRTAHHALLIDRGALRHFVSPAARALESSPTQHQRPLRVVAVATPLLLTEESRADQSGSGFASAATRALSMVRNAVRSLGGRQGSSLTDPVVPIHSELGHGLAPRSNLADSQQSAFNRATQPHA